MKNYMNLIIMLLCTIITYNLFSLSPKYPNTIKYLTYKDVPGYNTPMPEQAFNGIQPILFTPYEDTVTGDDSNEKQYGYFWDIKVRDKSLTYPGKARVGNSQYINVVAVDSKNINTTGDSASVVSIGTDDIYNPSVTQQQQFQDDYLVQIGTFMKKNDPTVYILYGMYQYTVIPDPRQVAVAGPTSVVSANPELDLEQ